MQCPVNGRSEVTSYPLVLTATSNEGRKLGHDDGSPQQTPGAWFQGVKCSRGAWCFADRSGLQLDVAVLSSGKDLKDVHVFLVSVAPEIATVTLYETADCDKGNAVFVALVFKCED